MVIQKKDLLPLNFTKWNKILVFVQKQRKDITQMYKNHLHD